MRSTTRLALLLALPATAAAQSTWYVDAAAAGPGTGTLADPFPSIQQAIDEPATFSGDTISVAPGVYLESLNTNGKSLRIEGDPASRPIVRGNGLERYLHVQSGESTGTEFVALEFAYASFGSQVDPGGAVQLDGVEVVFLDCIFRSNTACGLGGAVYSGASTVTFDSCHFLVNVAEGGGALYLDGSAVTIRHCVFDGNTTADCSNGSPGGNGGAIRTNNGTLVVEDSEFLRNGGTGNGGAISMNSSTPGDRIDRCVFVDNGPPPGASQLAVHGGALSGSSDLIATDCVFRRNRGNGGGAARGATFVRCEFTDNSGLRGAAAHDADLEECWIARNVCIDFGQASISGGAIAFSAATRCVLFDNRAGAGPGAAESSALDRCTVIGNSGLSFCAATLDAGVRNSIVYGNTSTLPAALTTQVSGGVVEFSIVEDDPATIAGPPLLIGRHVGDARLLPGSPAIDAADPALPTDPDGSPADIGAFTFDPSDRGGPSRYCVAKETSELCVPTLAMIGVPSRTGPPALLHVSGAPTGTVGLLLVSSDTATTSFFGGTLCLGGTLRRNSVAFAVPQSGCGESLTLSLDLGNIPFPAGSLVFTQVWFRDVLHPDGTGVGLSDAVVSTMQP